MLLTEREAVELQRVLDGLARRATPGATPIGTAWRANFQQGQELTATVELEPTGCYAAIAVGLRDGTDVDLQLIQVGDRSGVLARDDDHGSEAVVGVAPACVRLKSSPAGQVRLVLRGATGSGLAAMRLLQR